MIFDPSNKIFNLLKFPHTARQRVGPLKGDLGGIFFYIIFFYFLYFTLGGFCLHKLRFSGVSVYINSRLRGFLSTLTFVNAKFGRFDTPICLLPCE